jgi:hypothetical protein
MEAERESSPALVIHGEIVSNERQLTTRLVAIDVSGFSLI